MMNITTANGSSLLLLSAPGVIQWAISYVTISDATAGITAEVTDSGEGDATLGILLVTATAGVTKQVKNINVRAADGAPLTVVFWLGEQE